MKIQGMELNYDSKSRADDLMIRKMNAKRAVLASRRTRRLKVGWIGSDGGTRLKISHPIRVEHPFLLCSRWSNRFIIALNQRRR